MGMPNMQSLYSKAFNISTAIHNTMNSTPKVNDSAVAWVLEYHVIGAEFTYASTPICKYLVT